MAQDPPVARRLPVERTAHGEVVVDAYAWMRDRESEDVLSHLRVENEYTERALAHLADLRETLFQEIKSRIKETDLSVPARKRPYWYLTRTEEGKQYPVLCRRRDSADGPEEILLDSNLLAGDSDYFALGLLDLDV